MEIEIEKVIFFKKTYKVAQYKEHVAKVDFHRQQNLEIGYMVI